MNGRLCKVPSKTYRKRCMKRMIGYYLPCPRKKASFDFALQWIALHNGNYTGKGIPYKMLVQATEATILNLTGNKNERFYDQETLREICGCLINISPETCLNSEGQHHHTYISVTFAHYSVREYLNYNRPRNFVFDHRSIGRQFPKDHLSEIIFSEAQRIKSGQFLWIRNQLHG